MSRLKSLFVTPLKRGWDILRTVYWYNSLPWRILKSGGLVVVGFFCLSGGNLLYSFKPDWTFLNFVMAYGFSLILYGPVHHLVVIPVSLRLNHHDWWKRHRLGKRVPFWTLMGYFTVVVGMGLYPPEVMTFEFGALTRGRVADVNPSLTCRNVPGENRTVIHCRIDRAEGIHSVEVHNKGRVVVSDSSAPFEFELAVSELESVVGQKQFQVIMLDKNGTMLRRFVRSVHMIDPAGTKTEP